MTWNSPYSPPLYFDYFWFLNTNKCKQYYKPSQSNWYDSTHPVITWSDPNGAPAPLAGEAKTVWGARFNRNGEVALAGNFNVWLTFYFPDLGECAVSTTFVQPTPRPTTIPPTPTITLTPSKTPIPSKTLTPSKTPIPSRTPIPSKTFTPGPTNTKKPTSTPAPATNTPIPPTPTLKCFDC